MNHFRLISIVLVTIINTISVFAKTAPILESKGCTNEKRAELNRKCDPYQSHLIYVNKKDIKIDEENYRKPVKNPPKPRLNKGLSLTDAVHNYIDKQLSIQESKEKREKYKKQKICYECEYIHLYLTQDKMSRVFGDFKDIAPYIMMDKNKKYFFILRTNSGTIVTKKIKKEEKDIKKKRKKIPKIKVSQILHKVKKGETLSGIAYKYKSSIKDIRDLNNMGNDAFIKVGDIIRVPAKEKLILSKREFNKIRSMMGKYRVQKGESLGYLSNFFKVKVSDIATINNFDRHRKLRIGEEITLPLTQNSINNLVDIRRIEKEMAERDRKRKAKLKAIRKYSKKLKYTKNNDFKHKIRVVATAYTSHKRQTDDTPYLAAWNNPIRPGMKIIAVSPDLIRKYGLTNGIRVKISGLPGIYTVRDKMNKRLRNHIDIYMGNNIRRALKWGRRRVVLYW